MADPRVAGASRECAGVARAVPRAACAFAAVLALSCGGAGAAPPENPAAIAAQPSFQEKRWGTFHSKRFELSLSLPDGAAWRIDDRTSPWLKAQHPSTRSALLLRAWMEDQNVTRHACYARAREWSPKLPDLDSAPLIDDGVRALLDVKDARVAVGVTVGAAPEPLTGGFVVAVVGSIRRCVVLAFHTEASGAAAEDEVADRLALVAERLLPSLKNDQSFAPSREPVIPSRRGPEGGGGER